MRRRPAHALLALAALLSSSAGALAQTSTNGATVDRIVARFYAPETGGTAHPRFVAERTLAFEARIEVMAEEPEGIGGDFQERHVRAALDHHVGEAMLASLAHKAILELSPARRPSEADLAAVQDDLSAALLERLGGRGRVDEAARAEQLDASEVEVILRRQGLAAWYLDHAVMPILQPTDEQLHEVFRTSAHPYRGQPFEQARAALKRWFVVERVRVAESAFLQSARARVRIVVVTEGGRV